MSVAKGKAGAIHDRIAPALYFNLLALSACAVVSADAGAGGYGAVGGNQSEDALVFGGQQHAVGFDAAQYGRFEVGDDDDMLANQAVGTVEFSDA